MLIISLITDVFDALALAQEQAELAIMTRKPVDRRLNRLVDWKMVVQSYLFMGTLSTFSAMCCFFWYLQAVGGLHADCIFFAWTYGSDNFYTCS